MENNRALRESLFVKCLGYTARKANIYITELVQSGKLILVDIIIIITGRIQWSVLEFTCDWSTHVPTAILFMLSGFYISEK